jgi:hypothetical protein
MNWYKIANDMANQLSMLDTRIKADRTKANEIIIKALGIQVGDTLNSLMGMGKGYVVEGINPDFTVNLLSPDQRKMPNTHLYNATKRNMAGWEKV